MYKNTKKIYAYTYIWLSVQAVCVLPAVVFLGMTFDGKIYEDMADPVPTRLTYLFIALISLTPFIIFWSRSGYFSFINRLNELFCADADGFVPVSDLSREMGIPEYKIISLAESSIRKGYLINCNYNASRKAFLLSDKTGPSYPSLYGAPADNPFIGVHCPGCAASLKIRANTQGTCPYCGRLITAPSFDPDTNSFR